MAEHEESIVTEKIKENLLGSSTSCSSDSREGKTEPSTAVKSKVFRLFGREKPLHLVLGGGKAANVMLWRDKKMSAAMFIGATVAWVMLELVGYHLLTLVCNGLLISLVILFLWSKATTVINKSPPHVPEVSIPENQAVKIALEVRCVINRAFSLVREIALGRDLKKFLAVIVGLYFLSIVGNSVNLLSMLYILFVALHTMPILYEKYENKIDSFAEKAMVELKKQYATFDAKVLRKIPRGPLKHKQQ